MRMYASVSSNDQNSFRRSDTFLMIADSSKSRHQFFNQFLVEQTHDHLLRITMRLMQIYIYASLQNSISNASWLVGLKKCMRLGDFFVMRESILRTIQNSRPSNFTGRL